MSSVRKVCQSTWVRQEVYFRMTNHLGDWEALAEIYLEGCGQPEKLHINNSTYCLCSRVFIKYVV